MRHPATGESARAARAFTERWGCPPAVVADAPGRVNLIGEHTDYNGGVVLPVAIPQRTAAALAPRADDRVRVTSEAFGNAEYRLREVRPGCGWLDYVQGITWVLQAGGYDVRGFDLAIASDVPVGAGLSSSAALEVAVLRALRAAFALALDDTALALVGQRAENEFVGARVGVMDQMAASLADETSALWLDTRTLAHRRVALPAGLELVVIDSGVTHQHAGGAYNMRRAECEAAAVRLGVELLCTLPVDDLARAAALPDPLARRVRHVVTENARVEGAVAALEAGDLPAFGCLLNASHESLRDDYEVSSVALDTLVDLARAEPDVFGARLTGGGFGGCIVAAARAGVATGAARRIVMRYADRVGRQAAVILPVSARTGSLRPGTGPAP